MRLEPALTYDLRGHLVGEVRSWGVGADGAIAVLLHPAAPQKGEGFDAAAVVECQRRSRLAPDIALIALVASAAGVSNWSLERYSFRAPFVQQLSSGGLLVVDGHISVTDPPNGVLYAPGSRIERTANLGDGIAEVVVDDNDRAWVGYHEEGVYGSGGWGEPGGPEPIGWPGINRYDPATGAITHMDTDRAAAYAVNAIGDELWAMVHARGQELRRYRDGDLVGTWECPYPIVRNFAIDEQRAVSFRKGEPSTLSSLRKDAASLSIPYTWTRHPESPGNASGYAAGGHWSTCGSKAAPGSPTPDPC